MSRAKNIISGMPEHVSAVTPHDSTNLTHDSVIYIGGDGNVAVMTIHNETVTFVGMSAGDILPCKIRRVNDTNTTATNMVAMW